MCSVLWPLDIVHVIRDDYYHVQRGQYIEHWISCSDCLLVWAPYPVLYILHTLYVMIIIMYNVGNRECDFW
jgi:hypothetical protein